MSDINTQINWQELMSIGLGELRIPPYVFWSMTFPELKAAFNGANAERYSHHTVNTNQKHGISMDDLEEMIYQYPDVS